MNQDLTNVIVLGVWEGSEEPLGGVSSSRRFYPMRRTLTGVIAALAVVYVLAGCGGQAPVDAAKVCASPVAAQVLDGYDTQGMLVAGNPQEVECAATGTDGWTSRAFFLVGPNGPQQVAEQ
jgi:hypothetical protein